MNEQEYVISGESLSYVWGEMLRLTRVASHDPLLIVVDVDQHQPAFDIRSPLCGALDSVLQPAGFPTVRETSNTVFPYWMWQRRGCPGHEDFIRFVLEDYLPRYRARCRKRGAKIRESYFERMIAFPATAEGSDTDSHTNQLAHVIEYCQRYLPKQRPRRTAIQLGILNPGMDHSFAPMSGFPCLQQVGLTFEEDRKAMTVHAFFPSQYVIERALGNYIGLLNLGRFLATEIGLGVFLKRLCAYVSHPIPKGSTKKGLRPISAGDVDGLIEIATASQALPTNE